MTLGCVLGLALAACGGNSLPSGTEPGDGEVRPTGTGLVAALGVEVIAEYPHNPQSSTQGLLWFDGALFESTGQYGESKLLWVELDSGRALREVVLHDRLFGEGLARIGSRLLQLTWQSGMALTYDLNTFQTIDESPALTYRGEGWGLCYDGLRLVMSDGSAALQFRSPTTFAPLGEVEVTLEDRPLRALNELECVGNEVYANVLGRDDIVRIEPQSGRIHAVIDASALRGRLAAPADRVLNGIAYVPERGTFLLTGKNWEKLFEVKWSG